MTAPSSPARLCMSMSAGPHIDPQIELAKAVLAAKTPLFGSCWGLQVITVAAGGSVRKNPKGPRDRLRPPHPAHRRRTRAPDVCRQGRGVRCRHRASRRGGDGRAGHAGAGRAIPLSAVQSAEIRVGEARRLGHAISSRIFARATSRRPCAATASGWSRTASSRTRPNLLAYAKELDLINADPTIKSLAWRLALDQMILDKIDPGEGNLELDHASGAPDAREARTGVTMKFSGRHVVVTGGTGALGTAVVEALLECRGALPRALHRTSAKPNVFRTGRMSASSFIPASSSPTKRRSKNFTQASRRSGPRSISPAALR